MTQPPTSGSDSGGQYGQSQPGGSDPYGQPYGQSQPSADPYSQPYGQSQQSASDPYSQPYGQSQPSASDPYGQQQGYGVQSYPAQPYGYAQMIAPDHPKSTMVLVLGILALVLGGVTGPFAWYIGGKARKEVRANPGQYKDGGMLTVGWVLGIVGTVYLAFWVIFIIIYIVAIVAILGVGAASY